MKLKAVFFGFLVFFTQSLLPALDFPSYDPLFYDYAYSSDLTWKDMMELGYKCSEIDSSDARLQKGFEIFSSVCSLIDSRDFKALDEEEKGKRILDIIYKKILTRYEENQTRLDTALETGVYNCVSASLIYMMGAKYAGLEVRGQKTPVHAFCTVYLSDGRKIDVETTNPFGFDPGKKEIVSESDEYTEYYFVPKMKYRNRIEVSDKVFTGLVCGNLCSDYLKSGDYGKAVPLAAFRYLLLKNENPSAPGVADGRRDFDIVCGNFMGDYGTGNNLLNCVLWLKQVVDYYGTSDYMENIFNTCVYNMLISFTNAEKPVEAREALIQYKDYISKKQYSELDDIVFESEIQDFYFKQDPETFINYSHALKEQDKSMSKAKKEMVNLLEENCWIMILNDYGNSGDFLNGWYRSKDALEYLPASSKLKTMNRNFKSNAAIVIHNEFVDDVNGGFYENAYALLEKGLEIFPDNSTLKDDMRALKKAMKK